MLLLDTDGDYSSEPMPTPLSMHEQEAEQYRENKTDEEGRAEALTAPSRQVRHCVNARSSGTCPRL